MRKGALRGDLYSNHGQRYSRPFARLLRRGWTCQVIADLPRRARARPGRKVRQVCGAHARCAAVETVTEGAGRAMSTGPVE